MTFHKYTKIKILGNEENKEIFENPEDEIVLEEKVDGANIRFMIKDGNIIFGSRTQELHPDKEHKFQKNFQRCINDIHKKFLDLDEEVKQNSEGKIFYGECMVSHTMQYNWEEIPPFLGFDILSIQCNKFLGYKNKRNLFDAWNLNIVPLIWIGKVKDLKEKLKKNEPM